MIDADKRKSIFLLHQEGMSAREIAQRLHVSRNSVRKIVAQAGQMPKRIGLAKPSIDPDLLRQLYRQCEGRSQRVHEKLREEHGLPVKYSTLTRWLRQLGISKSVEPRCGQVPDEPGAEMQHDTSVYRVYLGEVRTKVVASLLYLRYSKRRYLLFYHAFNRFKMKCFLHEGLMHWGYAAKECIIDNTNLARLRGTGARAVLVPEMEAFAKERGFRFLCHAINHSNRKAGEERSFWTVETNFLPGRSFQSLEDLNQQAFQWATERMEHRPQGKAKLIPAKAFEHEVGFLAQLPAHLPAPYQIHARGIDQYGYVLFAANYFWVPGTGRGDVKVLEYSDRLRIYHARELLAEYPLPPSDVKNKPFGSEKNPVPRGEPPHRRQSSQDEEKHLRAIPGASAYLDFCLQAPGLQRHVFLRKLFAFSRKMTPELFTRTVDRALKYRITSLEVLERIARLQLDGGALDFSSVPIDETYQQRETYREGSLTDPPDLSQYDDHE
jgi:transposase